MKKCPEFVDGFLEKLKWHFSGYSFNITIDKELNLTYEDYKFLFEDIINNLRNRKYEHLLVNLKNRDDLKFAQTITNGKIFRLEYGTTTKDGVSKLFMYDNLTASECITAFCDICAYNSIPDLPWVDISDLYIKK